MLLYIDPGTGSMLFAVLIGAIGLLRYAFKGVLVIIRFILSGGKRVETNHNTVPLAIFTDDKRYWPVFEPVVRELDNRGFNVTYLTASPDDPVFDASYDHLTAEFIGEGNKAFAHMNFLRATMVLSTTPGLDVYQWKRSRDVKQYVFIIHSPGELTTNRMFTLDYFDTLLLSGQYQIEDCRNLEILRDQPEKECIIVGLPYLDEKAKKLKEGTVTPHKETVLVASSWGMNSLLNRYGSKLIDLLISTEYNIIIRPHPQSLKSEKEMLDKMMGDYPDLEWNFDTDNFEVLNRSDIMISDFSGVIFDYALVFDKPVICAYEGYDDSKDDAWWLDTPIWTATAIPRLGPVLNADNLPRIKTIIDEALHEKKYELGRREVRDETWMHRNEGAKRTADYLITKYSELTKEGDI